MLSLRDCPLISIIPPDCHRQSLRGDPDEVTRIINDGIVAPDATVAAMVIYAGSQLHLHLRLNDRAHFGNAQHLEMSVELACTVAANVLGMHATFIAISLRSIQWIKSPFFTDLQNPLLKKYNFNAKDFVVGSKEAFSQVHLAIASLSFSNFVNGYDWAAEALPWFF